MELLVVVAIIGMLLSLLLPAVQSAREGSRRISCEVKLADLAKALHNYESANRKYAVGAHNSSWKTWVVQLAPFFEEKTIAERYVGDKQRYSPETRFNSEANKAVTQNFLSQLACPSDGFSPIRTTMENAPSAHNYVGCTGNGAYVATRAGWLTRRPAGTPGGAVPSPGYGNGMFRWQGGAFVMSGATSGMEPPEDPLELCGAIAVKVSDVSDGLSKTLAFSEVIRRPPQPDGSSADYRGLSWWGPGALFSTLVPPNGSYPDTLPAATDCGPEDYDVEPPCYGPHSRSLPIVVAARSRHRDGVVASFLDGHTEFVADSIERQVWEGQGTTQGRD